MFTTTSRICFEYKYLNEIRKARQLLIVLFVLLPAFVTTTVANSNRAPATETETTARTNAHNKILSPATLSSTNSSKFATINAWGHNTKYSTILFDENIVVKGSALLDVKYPKSDNLHNVFTIIGVYSCAINKLDLAGTAEILDNEFSVHILEGGVGYNFTTVRYVSTAFYDIEFNLKIFGINV